MYKPFNLQAALDGAPVVTRDGRSVKIAGYNEDAKDGNDIAAWVGGVILCWYKNGSYSTDFNCQHGYDLFMAPTERKEWIVRGANGNVVFGPYKVKAHAESCYLVDQGATIHEITITE
jgi:hypothetical protein